MKWDQTSGGYEPLFDVPFSEKAVKQLIGKINQIRSTQGAAATVTANNGIAWVADFNGVIGDAFVLIGPVGPATGESVVYDLQKSPVAGGGFASVLTGTYSYGHAQIPSPFDIVSIYNLIDKTKAFFVVGDVLSVVRTYTAGGTPALGAGTTNELVIEPTLKFWQ